MPDADELLSFLTQALRNELAQKASQAGAAL